MSARHRRTVRSFAVVFAAFWLYRLAIVPWIDPAFVLEEQAGGGEGDSGRISKADEQRMQKYARIFPPGSWELDEPIILESEGVELLMKDYENLSNGRIRLAQCTMLYRSSETADDKTQGRIVILRAAEGAILQFDSELNLRRGQIGRLIGGQLLGPVTIHGTPSRPGADDELFVATRNVRLDMDQHKGSSNELVEFRYGPNNGRGRELVIHLAPTRGGSSTRHGPNVGGFERIELLHDIEMHMQPSSAGLFPVDEDRTRTMAAASAAGNAAERRAPLEIRCQGPFSFDLPKRVATFEHSVNVYRALAQGVFDQMACEELQIFFTDKPRPLENHAQIPAAQRDNSETRLSLQPERFVAKGNPVTIDAPSSGLFVRANEVEYGHLQRRIRIEAAPRQSEATLTWNDAKLNGKFGGRSLTVERADEKRLPLVSAKGQGWFEMAEPGDASRVLRARWSRELQMRADAGYQLVSLVGDAHADFETFGDLSGAEIHLWLKEFEKTALQAAAARGNVQSASNPSRIVGRPSTRQLSVAAQHLLATGNVRFDSPQLSGDTQRLEVDFDPDGTLLPTPKKATESGAVFRQFDVAPGDPPNRALAASSALNRGPTEVRTPAELVAAVDKTADTSMVTALPSQHFELHGESIRAQLVSEGELTQLNHATLNGRVQLKETRTEKPGDLPIEITGDLLELRNAARPRQTTMMARGQPALVAARGMEMQGACVNLDRSRNLLWIDGAGRTVLPPRPPGNRSTAIAAAPNRGRTAGFDSLSGAPVAIEFTGGMRFDGKMARYADDVTVESKQQTVRQDSPNGLETQSRNLKTDVVEVTLRRPIDFAGQQQAPADAEVEKIACLGPVTMTQHTSDNRGPVANETLSTRDLTVDQLTGEIHGLGPGWLESTRLGSSDAFLPGGRTRSEIASTKPDTPQFVHVDYQGPITGNVQHRELVLHDDIRGVYGPVAHWGEKVDTRTTQIGPQEFRFRSDELHVREAPGVQPNTTTTELLALGNTDIDGQSFSARAHRLTYVAEKTQLILEGDGRSAAELYYRRQLGAPWTRAMGGKLEYWVNTGEAKIPDAQFFELGQIGPAGRPGLK